MKHDYYDLMRKVIFYSNFYTITEITLSIPFFKQYRLNNLFDIKIRPVYEQSQDFIIRIKTKNGLIGITTASKYYCK